MHSFVSSELAVPPLSHTLPHSSPLVPLLRKFKSAAGAQSDEGRARRTREAEATPTHDAHSAEGMEHSTGAQSTAAQTDQVAQRGGAAERGEAWLAVAAAGLLSCVCCVLARGCPPCRCAGCAVHRTRCRCSCFACSQIWCEARSGRREQGWGSTRRTGGESNTMQEDEAWNDHTAALMGRNIIAHPSKQRPHHDNRLNERNRTPSAEIIVAHELIGYAWWATVRRTIENEIFRDIRIHHRIARIVSIG